MKLTSKDRKALEHGLRGIAPIHTDLLYGNICVAVEQIVDRHVEAAIARAEAAEARVAAGLALAAEAMRGNSHRGTNGNFVSVTDLRAALTHPHDQTAPTEDAERIDPIRNCCQQRHHGPVCPDGLTMCQHCFRRVRPDQLHVLEPGDGSALESAPIYLDVCKTCKKREDQWPAADRSADE